MGGKRKEDSTAGRTTAVALGLICTQALAAPPDASAITFDDVTSEAGVDYVQHTFNAPEDCLLQIVIPPPPPFFPDIHCTDERTSGGIAAGDYDGDGWTDLYVTRVEGPDILFRNLGNGTFDDMTSAAGLDLDLQTNGAGWADIDNDGDLDLYVTTIGDQRFYLFINDGAGAFTERGIERGAASANGDPHGGMSVAFGDYDRDGWLDIFASEWRALNTASAGANSNNVLLRNLGDADPGHFEDTTVAAGVSLVGIHPGGELGFSPAFVDLDSDGWLDLTVVSDDSVSRLFWNDGDGTFTDGTAAANVGTDENGMGSTFGDYDGDGDLDWFVSSIYCPETPTYPTCSGNRLYRYDGNRTFSDQTDTAGVRHGFWGWGTAFADFDNDGDLDIVQTNGMDLPLSTADDAYHDDPTRYWQNDGTGTMSEVSASVGLTDTRLGRGLVTLDYDKDGDLDIFVATNGGAPILWENDGGNTNDWLRVEVRGTAGTNLDGIGARIELTATPGADPQIREYGAATHFLGQSEHTAHFGLGPSASAVHQVRVEWPRSGDVQTLSAVSPNDTLLFIECNDGNACTDDAFVEGSGCVNTPNNDACDDGIFCNGADNCSAGSCSAHAGDPCAAGGECADSCSEGSQICTTNFGVACSDDGNVCTNDICNGAGSCFHPVNSLLCDDGLFCNGTDACSAGACSLHSGDPCSGGPECADICDEAADTCNLPAATVCTDDGNSCTDDSCDGAGTCAHTANSSACDDGSFCNGTDTCGGGSCSVHTGDPCSGGPQCADTCNEGSDTCYLPAATPCADDGNPCTDDFCSGDGTCDHVANSAPCDDGLFCNGTDTCNAGACSIHSGTPCTGTECGNICTEATDSCNVAAGVACADDGNECTLDVCDGQGDCTHAPLGGTCDDNDACTSGDLCDGSGLCVGSAISCDDGDACTVDSCDSGLGCVNDSGPREPATCFAAGQIKLAVKSDGENSKLSFAAKRFTASPFDAGNPAVQGGPTYALCIYDRAGGLTSLALSNGVAAGGDCDGRPCWKASGPEEAPRGFSYKNKSLTPQGVKSLKLRIGADENAKLKLRGAGSLLGMPAPVDAENALFAIDPGMTVQLVHDAGACWSTELGPADITKHSGHALRARIR